MYLNQTLLFPAGNRALSSLRELLPRGISVHDFKVVCNVYSEFRYDGIAAPVVCVENDIFAYLMIRMENRCGSPEVTLGILVPAPEEHQGPWSIGDRKWKFGPEFLTARLSSYFASGEVKALVLGTPIDFAFIVGIIRGVWLMSYINTHHV